MLCICAYVCIYSVLLDGMHMYRIKFIVFADLYIYMCMYICMYVCVRICVCVCIYIYIYIYIYVYIYVCIDIVNNCRKNYNLFVLFLFVCIRKLGGTPDLTLSLYVTLHISPIKNK